MSSVVEVERVSGLYRSLEDKMRRRTGLPAPQARQALARDFRCAPGTLTDILKRRVKGVDGWLRDRIEAALLKAIRAEIERLTNEELAITGGRRDGARAQHLAEIEEDLIRLRAIIAERSR